MNNTTQQDGEHLIVSPKAYDERGKETYHVAGATQERCNKCQDAIWLAPSSQAMINDGGPPFELVCMECLFTHYAEHLPKAQIRTAPGASQEMAEFATQFQKRIEKYQAGIMDIKKFVVERDEALRSLDIEKINAYMKKYDVKRPPDDRIFWAGIHKGRLMVSNMTEAEKEVSRQWLRDNGFSDKEPYA